jgi:hypothetical protein
LENELTQHIEPKKFDRSAPGTSFTATEGDTHTTASI